MSASAHLTAPLRVGDAAPDFVLADAAGRPHRLSDFRGSPVVLTFHPSHWDPALSAYAAAYNRLVAEQPALREARLLRIAGEGPWHEATFADATPAVPLLSGETGEVARRYAADGAFAVFVIDAQGTIRWRHAAAVDGPPRARDLADALRPAGAAMPDESMPDESLPDESLPDEKQAQWSRRHFVATALGAACAMALEPLAARAEAAGRTHSPTADPMAIPSAQTVTLDVNGRAIALELEPRVTLLDALREYAGLTGSKKGCDHGQCGACTVHIDGRRVLSCLTLALMAQGHKVTTIEGLAASAGLPADALHPMQQAFLTHDGFQCGYCTPGQIMSACAVLREPIGPSDADVREAMSGNLCRCGAYPGIVAAVQEARHGQNATAGGASSGA